MTASQVLDTDTIVGHYALANTPGFLYRKLKEEPSVRRLANELTTAELFAIVSECDGKEERSVLDVAVAYAALAAMSLQDYTVVRSAIMGWQPKALAWGYYFLERLVESKIHTNNFSIAGRSATVDLYGATTAQESRNNFLSIGK
jgi:hypothetical protein